MPLNVKFFINFLMNSGGARVNLMLPNMAVYSVQACEQLETGVSLLQHCTDTPVGEV